MAGDDRCTPAPEGPRGRRAIDATTCVVTRTPVHARPSTTERAPLSQV
jgi:hypothetical protein